MCEVVNMKDVQTQITELTAKNVAGEILIAFDIDMTLTQPDHPAVYYPTLRKHVDVYKQIMGTLTPEQKDLAVMQTLFLPQKLVDDATPALINKLQNNGFKTIAFTASTTGDIKNSAGEQVKIAQLRFDTLKKFNIDFSKTFVINDITFAEIPSHNGNHPVFYNGILLANGEKGAKSKGPALVAFLKRVQLTPKVVVMVDDKRKNLDDIQHYLQQHDSEIEFVGIEYKGAFDYAPKETTRDEFVKYWQMAADMAKL